VTRLYTITAVLMSGKLLMNTGSSDLWVSEIHCSDCGNKRKYNPKQDGSFRTNNKPFEVIYGIGYVQGYIGSADLSLNGALIPQVFAFTTKMAIFQDEPFDGII
ncbi:9483_t:CDS:2, partial [Acaulospora morrowiae]